MDKQKEIEQMAEVLEAAKTAARQTFGSLNQGFGMWYATALINAGYRLCGGDNCPNYKYYQAECERCTKKMEIKKAFEINAIKEQAVREFAEIVKMSKAVMISIKPKWCELIVSGKKTIEVRKTTPKLQTPFKCYIYMTATKERCRFWEYITAYQNSKGEMLDGSQKVIGEFICDSIEVITCHKSYNGVGFDYTYYTESKDTLTNETQLTDYVMQQYLGCAEDGECVGYAWHISDLKIYDKPKELGEFQPYCNPDTCVGCRYFSNGACAELTYCSRRPLTRSFQSWGYVEEVK